MKKFILMLFAASVLASCANSQPYEYRRIDEVPDGPGLFSGEDGEFTIYSK